MASFLDNEYKNLKKVSGKNLKGSEVSESLFKIITKGILFLNNDCSREILFSQVPQKNYFDFKFKNKFSRPINENLFFPNLNEETLHNLLFGDTSKISPNLLSKALYTGAMAYCAVNDVLKNGDKKSPGTFFECYIGHFVAQKYGVNPQKYTEVQSIDIINKLTTDYIFNLGKGKRLIHLPIKTSTRERVVQVWAHQRVLDGIHGTNRFRAILSCLAETNKKSKERAVVEVCLPGQWALYQRYISELHRVYYLDLPDKYSKLKNTFPYIHVVPFSEFFEEAEALISN